MPRDRPKRRTKGSEGPNAVVCLLCIMYGAWSDSPRIGHLYRVLEIPGACLRGFIERSFRAMVSASSERLLSSFNFVGLSPSRTRGGGTILQRALFHVFFPICRMYGAAHDLNRTSRVCGPRAIQRPRAPRIASEVADAAVIAQRVWMSSEPSREQGRPDRSERLPLAGGSRQICELFGDPLRHPLRRSRRQTAPPSRMIDLRSPAGHCGS
jgi:hypothetical protein